jgi:hypothetical protein
MLSVSQTTVLVVPPRIGDWMGLNQTRHCTEEKISCPYWELNLESLVTLPCLVTVPTELFWLPCPSHILEESISEVGTSIGNVATRNDTMMTKNEGTCIWTWTWSVKWLFLNWFCKILGTHVNLLTFTNRCETLQRLITASNLLPIQLNKRSFSVERILNIREVLL